MQDKIFYSSSFGFLIGVLLRSFMTINIYIVFLITALSVAVIFFFLLAKNKWAIVAAIFTLTISLGILRFHSADIYAPSSLENTAGKTAELSGRIIDEPQKNETGKRITVLITGELSEAKILLSTDSNTDLKYGDEIKFIGKLEKPENFLTDQGKVFDYIHYLRKDGILYTMNNPKIEIVSRDGGSPMKRTLFSIKEKFTEKIDSIIPSPESLLMGGLILGEKSSLDKNLKESFVKTGTIHIVALSGYNVTIVARGVMGLFAFFFPRGVSVGAGGVAIILFIIMTGGSSTAVRAGIMALTAILAKVLGRPYEAGRALLLAGVVMIILNPLILAFDVSFQLSFIATIAVIFISPRFEKYFLWVTKKFDLRGVVSVTCAAYIFVLPFILYKTGNLSLVALPANILILPIIPFTMLFGFLTGIISFFSHFLALPIGYFTYFMLHYELSIIQFFSSLSFSAYSIPNFPLLITVLMYVHFIYYFFWHDIREFFREID